MMDNPTQVNKTPGKRKLVRVIMSDDWTEDVPFRAVLTTCPECKAALTPQRDLCVPNGWYDTHGAGAKCEQCGYQEFQVIDEPVKRRR